MCSFLFQPLYKWTLFQARGRSASENQNSSYVKVSDGLGHQLSLFGFAGKVDQCINSGVKAPVVGVAARSLALPFTYALMVYKTE